MGKEDAFIPPDEEEILQILKLMEESEFDELRLEMAGLKLAISKGMIDITGEQMDRAATEPSRAVASGGAAPAAAPSAVRPGITVQTERTPERPVPGVADLDEEGVIPVKSPLLGIFYRAPKPGAPPFVEAGACVKEDDTVCLIEVMKLFNTVKAGVKGRIARICAENNQMVEYNQTLFLIAPEGCVEGSAAG